MSWVLAPIWPCPMLSAQRFNEQVRRNLECFPADFIFQLTEQE